MSTEMDLEADASFSEETAITVLNACGVRNFLKMSEGFRASFPASEMPVFYRRDATPTTIQVPGIGPAAWRRSSITTFRYVSKNFELCNSDMRTFVEKLVELTESYFVLSLQLESIQASRDSKGLLKGRGRSSVIYFDESQ